MKHLTYFQTFSLRMKCPTHYFGWVLACLWVCLTGSCDTDHDSPATGGGKMILNLRLDTSGMFTRSNDGEEGVSDIDLTGVADENEIDWGDVWIAAFDATNGERIGVLYPSATGSDVSDGNTVSVSVDLGEHAGDVRIVVLANWSRYGISIEALDEIENSEGLNVLTFSFLPDNLDTGYYPLPMYGSTDLPMPTEKDVSIGMTRALAKIEIVDKMEGEVSIESATLCKYAQSGYVFPTEETKEGRDVSTAASGKSVTGRNVSGVSMGNGRDGIGIETEDLGTDLPFKKIDGESGRSTFYVYVPEISLGDANSELRKIRLTLSDGNESEISLINYDDNRQPSTELSDVWTTLQRNRIYRFNVTGLIPTEPEIEIQPTIRICWYTTSTIGKLKDVNSYLFLFSNESSTNINKNDEKTKELFRNVCADGHESIIPYFTYYCEYRLNNGESFANLNYILADEGKFYNSYRYDSRNLNNDIVKLENIDNITYCWLNNCPYAFSHYINNDWIINFNTDIKHRIYFSGDKNGNYTMSLRLKSNYIGSLDLFNNGRFQYDETRNLCYFDFIVNGNEIKGVECKISKISINNVTGGEVTLTPFVFSSEFIGSEEYYVFYAN